ncbi:MAG: hypothetical protein IT462_03380 [Planctomycetes bacterium]|nr:hypothetical protein [Planctomycetota bacterium]
MPKIALINAKPGMILGQPVEDDLGRVVLGAGEALTDDLIRLLLKRGHNEIQVRGDTRIMAAASIAQIPEARRREIENQLEARFARGEGDSNMQLFKRVARAALLPEAGP